PEPDRRPAALEFEEPFDLKQLLGRRLAEKLKPVADKRWQERFIGRTRIILVPDTGVSELLDERRREPDPGHSVAFERLSVFRHGFTQTMAHRALTNVIPGPEVRAFLDEQVQDSVLLKVSNIYFFRDEDRANYLAQMVDPVDRALAHRHA